MRLRHWIALFATIALAVPAGCGGGDDAGKQVRPVQHTERDAPAVIRRWADTLRRGDVRGAARFFAIPSLVSNGTPPIVLHTRR